MNRTYPIEQSDIDNAKLKLANKDSYKPTIYPTRIVKRKASDRSVKKTNVKQKQRKSPKPPLLPIVSLDEAIKRLNDDKTYAKVAKAMSWKDELD